MGVRWGVGGAIAQKFAQEGFFVVLTTRRTPNATLLDKAIQVQGGESMIVELDLTSSESIAFLDIFKGCADFGNAGAFVIGDEIPGWRDLDLANLPLAIYLDGKFASRGGLSAPSEPFPRDRRLDFSEMVAGLHWVANTLSQRGFGMRKGQTITTGSAAQILAEPGAEAIMRYGEGGEFGEIQILIHNDASGERS